MEIYATVGQVLTIWFTTYKRSGGVPIDQPGGLPLVSIEKIVSGAPVEVLAWTLMSKARAGEYFYDWTVPDEETRYKVKYKGEFNSTDLIDFDFVVAGPVGSMQGMDEFRTFTYNPDKTVNYVDIAYGPAGSPVATYRYSFVYDAELKVTDMNIEKI